MSLPRDTMDEEFHERARKSLEELERLVLSSRSPQDFFRLWLRELCATLGADQTALIRVQPNMLNLMAVVSRLPDAEREKLLTNEQLPACIAKVCQHRQTTLRGVDPAVNRYLLASPIVLNGLVAGTSVAWIPAEVPEERVLHFTEVVLQFNQRLENYVAAQPVSPFAQTERNQAGSSAPNVAAHVNPATPGNSPLEVTVMPSGTEVVRAHGSQGAPTTIGPSPVPNSSLADVPLELIQQLHKSLQLSDVTAVVANDGRQWIGCDRVTVLLRRGSRYVVEAVSGQVQVQPRATVVKQFMKLTKVVALMREPLYFDGHPKDWPEHLERAVTEFLQESGSRQLAVVPLFEPLDEPPELEPDKPRSRRREPEQPPVFGCLFFEYIAAGDPSPVLNTQAARWSELATVALHNARTHESLFLLPLWQTLGQWWQYLWYRKRNWAIAGAVSAVAISLALWLVPWQYRVEGQGLLMPQEKHDLFVPYDGDVLEVLVTSGQRVKKGDLAVRLRNNELQSELVAARSQWYEKRQMIQSLQSQAEQAEQRAQQAEAGRLRGQQVEAEVQAHGLERQVTILTERLTSLDVRVPLDGVVSTFQIEQLLKDRPVKRGETLLTVMDDNGPWQLELEVAEHRCGHLLKAQMQLRPELPIEFMLMTQPETTYRAEVREISTRAAPSVQNELVVPVLADVDISQIADRRIGAEVRARISCGTKPLGYCLFGDIVEFVQRYVWW